MAAPSLTAELPAAPTPQQMHAWIRQRTREKKHFTITTMSPEQVQWQALNTHRNMETRACFHTGSRIHTLVCGHSAAVMHNAEPCATNCGHSTTMVADNAPVPIKYATTLGKIRESIDMAMRTYRADLRDRSIVGYENCIITHEALMSNVVWQQNMDLRPSVDLAGGNFACKICEKAGDRDTNPAYYLNISPYFCVVVGWTFKDRDVIRKLLAGIQPSQSATAIPRVHPAQQVQPALTGPTAQLAPIAPSVLLAQLVLPAQVTQNVQDEMMSADEQSSAQTLAEESGGHFDAEDIDLIDL